jgi:hypothetical protein
LPTGHQQSCRSAIPRRRGPEERAHAPVKCARWPLGPFAVSTLSPGIPARNRGKPGRVGGRARPGF